MVESAPLRRGQGWITAYILNRILLAWFAGLASMTLEWHLGAGEEVLLWTDGLEQLAAGVAVRRE